MKKLILLAVFITVVSTNLLAGPRITTVDKKAGSVMMMPGDFRTAPFTFYTGPGLVMEGQKSGEDYIIGPEQEIAGMSGFYDWQTNGDSKHFIYRFSDAIMHAVYMSSADSVTPDPVRTSRYSYSTNGGTSWTFNTDIPTGIRNGYPTVTSTSDGSAVIANHYGSPLNSYIHVDAFPVLGSFTSTVNSFSASVWPQVNRLTNNNILVVGSSYQSGAATDTIIAQVFNPATSTFSNLNKLLTPASTHLNMRWASATAPGGKAIIVVAPISDVGGALGGNRGFYFTSNDNGATWSSAQQFFETNVTGADTNTIWLGIDVAYDNTGNNFYITYNTIGTLFTSAKIMMSKNGGPGVVVAANDQITGAMSSPVGTQQANSISMDWSSVAVSDDGLFVFCTYTVIKQNDTLNAWNSGDIYYSASPTSALAFSTPVQVTSGITDERYSCLERVALTDLTNTYRLHLSYQKDPQPGSMSFSDLAPKSRASLVYRTITQAQVVGVHNIGTETPNKFSLSQNYPNPFNPSTSIRFALPKTSNVVLKIYNLNGQEVATLLNNEVVTAGTKEIQFNGSNLSSGVYFYSISAGDFKETKKMTLIK